MDVYRGRFNYTVFNTVKNTFGFLGQFFRDNETRNLELHPKVYTFVSILAVQLLDVHCIVVKVKYIVVRILCGVLTSPGVVDILHLQFFFLTTTSSSTTTTT